jgi:hypothetical protein
MPIELFILLGIMSVTYLATRGADRKWRKDNGILPMTKEEQRINDLLRDRRNK